MNSERIKDLRDQMLVHYSQGEYHRAAQCMLQLEAVGDRSSGWWAYALILAAAMGDFAIADASIRVLEKVPVALMRALKAAWSNAVSAKHWSLATFLGQRLSQLLPGEYSSRVLDLIHLLERENSESEKLKQLMADPLPLADLSPTVLRKLIGALRRAGRVGDAGRMLGFLLCKYPPFESAARENAALLASNVKRYDLVISLLEGSTEPRHRYLYSLACLQLLAWEDLARTQLSSAELQTLLDEDANWTPSKLWQVLMLPGYTNADHLALARRASSAMHMAVEVREHIRPAHRPKRLRVGYLSGDFRVHPCNQMACAMLESHDASRFELIAFDNSRDDGSAERRRTLDAFDEVIAVRNLATCALADVIRNAGIDILVDMSGYTSDNRVDVLAWRPAPVQMTWLGFPGGLGGALADYFVADGISVPAGFERDFDEGLIRLPGSYLPGGEYTSVINPPTRQSQGLPDDALVFACFNQLAKISGETFGSWCDLLRAVPQGVLWMMYESEDKRECLTAAAARRGISSSRLYWAERTRTQKHHVNRIACADLILDTHPYTMHTTAVDALAAGVPFLTFCGETVASRVSSSLLTTAGLGDCVCANAEDYLQRMVALAQNAPARTRLRNRFLVARSESPLFDCAAFARNLEAAYDQVYARWLAADLPADITVGRALGGCA